MLKRMCYCLRTARPAVCWFPLVLLLPLRPSSITDQPLISIPHPCLLFCLSRRSLLYRGLGAQAFSVPFAEAGRELRLSLFAIATKQRPTHPSSSPPYGTLCQCFWGQFCLVTWSPSVLRNMYSTPSRGAYEYVRRETVRFQSASTHHLA